MKSVRLKLAVLLMIVVSAVLLAVYLTQVLFLPTYYQAAKTKQLKKLASQVEASLAKGSYSEETLTAEASAYEAIVEIYEADGSLYYTTYLSSGRGMGMGMNMNPYMMRGQYLQYLDSFLTGSMKSFLQVIPESRTNQKILFYALRTKSGSSIIITSPVTPLTSVLKILKAQLAVILIAALLFAGGVSLFLSGIFIRPVVNLSRAAHRVSEGQLSVRVFNPAKDEVGRLTQDFNQMVERLSVAEQAKRDVLANVSHDLKTPLTMIQGYAQALADSGCNDPKKTVHHLDIIRTEAERLGILVGDILELTRLQSGNVHLVQTDFDLYSLATSVSERYDLMRENGIEILLTPIKSETYAVHADPNRIEQVLYNLVGNAINHIGEDKKVTIALSVKEDRVLVTVSDTGVGIAEDEIPKIWERYYSKQSSGKRLVVGTGLGLAIVRELLEAHKAPFGVRSSPGQGAAFWFELPRA